MPFDTDNRSNSVPAALTITERKRANAFGKLRSETLLRKLEPRIMFDAAAVATAVDALHHDAAADATHAVDAAAHSPAELAALAAHMHGPVVIQGDVMAKSVVFIDANVQDPAAIEKAVASNAEIVLLDANQDGLLQIANFLQGRAGLDAIHIVSHGAQGELFLGNSVVTAASLAGADTELDAVGGALHAGGDILLYGCDVAQGATGDAFVHQFASLTHANVAASTDLTGTAAQGGNWVLEDHVGAVHTAAIQGTGWQGELNTVVTQATSNAGVTTIFANNLIGVGIKATNQAQIGGYDQFGTFTNDATGLGLSKIPLANGIVMVTGVAGTAATPTGNTSTTFTSHPMISATDASLNTLSGNAGIFQAAGYTFDFTATTNRIGFVFSLASEEYSSYVAIRSNPNLS